MAHEIVWEDNGVKVITTGALDNDFLDSTMVARKDPRFMHAKYSIVDFRGVENFPIESSMIKQIAISDTEAYRLNPNMKLAILANKLVITGLIHIYKAYFALHNNEEHWDIRIFETEDEAREWIDARQATVSPGP